MSRDPEPPLTVEDIGCQYCWADPRYTTITDDKERRCPVCGSDYTGPRRPNLMRFVSLPVGDDTPSPDAKGAILDAYRTGWRDHEAGRIAARLTPQRTDPDA